LLQQSFKAQSLVTTQLQSTKPYYNSQPKALLHCSFKAYSLVTTQVPSISPCYNAASKHKALLLQLKAQSLVTTQFHSQSPSYNTVSKHNALLQQSFQAQRLETTNVRDPHLLQQCFAPQAVL
jgi:hypothetical protein